MAFCAASLFCLYSPSSSAREVWIGPKPKVTWKLNNGYIVHSSVCYQHAFGSPERERCRSYARIVFKNRCKAAKTKLRNHGSHASKGMKQERTRYCQAARAYRP